MIDIRTLYTDLKALQERLSNGDHPEGRKTFTVEDAQLINQVIEYIERNEPATSLNKEEAKV